MLFRSVAGPFSKDALPQIFAGGALGHDPLETGGVVAVDVGSAVAVVGAVVVGVGAVVVVVGVGAVVVGAGSAGGVAVGSTVGVGVAPVFATLKYVRPLEVVPSDHVSTTLMLCDPLDSSLVSYGSAVPLLALPAKSNGALSSVRTGGCVPCGLSR